MKPLIVVDDLADWPAETAHPVVTATDYLHEEVYEQPGAWRVLNLCQCHRYQSAGYYVSMLAEAREHRPQPTLSTILSLQSPELGCLALPGLDALVQRSLATSPPEKHSLKLRICFGRDAEGRYDNLSRQIFERLPAPLIGAHFLRRGSRWYLSSVRPLAMRQVPRQHHGAVARAAQEHLAVHRPTPKFRLAILRDENNPLPASNPLAIEHFIQAAAELGIHAETIGRHDGPRLAEFDGLFIRDNTFIRHYTYRFSRMAAARGMVVIDDPESVLHCNNKIYLAELLARHGVATPRTLIVDRRGVSGILSRLPLPCVLKQPDSCLSLGVEKADTADDLERIADEFLRHSQLILAQEFLPTDFDWRIGIIDGHPLFACRYYMVPGHWQIVCHDGEGDHYEEGATTAVPLDQVPKPVLRLALKAAQLIGDGFYGVDIKEVGRRYYVIEINDNPNVDAGNEDGVLKDLLYRDVMSVFARRLEARRGHRDVPT
jgi:glutathione synthase/RimK-type ligase-like ATP-grasp enzyme